MGEKRGFTLIELAVVLTISAIIMWLGYSNFRRWSESSSIEGDIQKMYSEIQKERVKAFTQKLEVEIFCGGNVLTIKEKDLSSGKTSTLTLNLNNQFVIENKYKKIKINKKGLFSITGKIEYNGIYHSSPKFDCLVISKNRIRMEKCK